MSPYLAKGGLLVGVQNGMSLDIIADAVGHRRTLGCVIEITSARFTPGVVERRSPADRSWFAVGTFHDFLAIPSLAMTNGSGIEEVRVKEKHELTPYFVQSG